MEKISNIPVLSRKQFLDTLVVLINAELVDSICGVVDGIFVGRFLGADAIAAHGIATPIFTIMSIFIYLITAAFQQPCTVCIGRGDMKKANGLYSATMLLSMALSVFVVIIGMLFPHQTASLLGARGAGPINDMAADYLRAVFPGTPALIFFLVLIPVLQIEGKRRLTHIGALVMGISDIAFDFLNVKVLHWGMFGIGLSTTVSYILGLLVLLSYFFNRNRIFHFRLKDIRGIGIRHMFLMGLPTGVRMAGLSLAVVIVNTFMMGVSGPVGMSALSVQQNLSSLLMSMIIGLSGTTMLLTGVSFGEQDRRGLMDIVRMSAYYCLLFMSALGILVFCLARPLVSLYLNPAEEAFPLAVDALRWLALSFPFMGWSRCVGSYLQGIEKNVQAIILSLLDEMILLLLCAVVLGKIWGIQGIFASFVVSQMLAVLLVNLQAFLRRDRRYGGMEAFLGVPPSFGVPPENRLVRTVTTLEEVWALSAEAMDYCLDHGISRRKAYMASLYIEEMGNIMMLYGFNDGKPHHLEVRLSLHQGEVILRLRDDCRRFDIREKAAHWEEDPLHPETTFGVRMVMKGCKILQYDNSLKTNNLLVVL